MSLSKACYPDVQWRAFLTEKYLLDRTLSSKVSMKEQKKNDEVAARKTSIYIPSLQAARLHRACDMA